MDKTKIYLAGPFFDDEQIERIERVEAALAENPTVGDVFSPRKAEAIHREGSPAWAQEIFEMDRQHIDQAEVMLAVIDYEQTYVDPGTAWETGYAAAKRKPVVLLKEKADGTINLMMGVPAQAVLTAVTDLAGYDFGQLPAQAWTGPMF